MVSGWVDFVSLTLCTKKFIFSLSPAVCWYFGWFAGGTAEGEIPDGSQCEQKGESERVHERMSVVLFLTGRGGNNPFNQDTLTGRGGNNPFNDTLTGPKGADPLSLLTTK